MTKASNPEGIAQLIAKWRTFARTFSDRGQCLAFNYCAVDLEALVGRLPRGEGLPHNALDSPDPPNAHLIALARAEAFQAGFCAHYGKAPGDWVFDRETCIARDLHPQAFEAWKAEVETSIEARGEGPRPELTSL